MVNSLDKNTNRKYSFLIFACVFIWIITTGSKNVFTAEIVELTNIFNTTKDQLSLCMTYYFITYSSLQILLFFVMDKLDIKWYILVTMGLSGVVTVLIAFATKLYSLWIILSINGILQAGIWGICIGTLKNYLPSYLIPKALALMSIGTAIAGVVSYGSSAIAVAINFWNIPYIVLGVILTISAFIFFIAVKKCSTIKTEKNSEAILVKHESNNVLVLSTKFYRVLFLIVAFTLSIAIHFVFYGTLNWIPSLITEVYGKSPSFGILISVLAPLATTIGPIIAIKYTERFKNYLYVLLFFVVISGILSIALYLTFDLGLVLALIILILYLLILHASVTIINSVLSIKTGEYINSGAFSCLMNAAGGFSAGFAPTLLALVIDGIGWNSYYLIIALITIGITLITLLGIIYVNIQNAKAKRK